MSVVVYTESENGKFKKNAFEVASYAKAVADQLGTSVTAISINNSENDSLCLLYTSPSPRDRQKSRMPSSA